MPRVTFLVDLQALLQSSCLNGQKIVVVRCEALNISGEFFRAKLKYHAYLRKMTRYNPTRGGPFHFRAPSRIFYKTVRGCPTTIRQSQARCRSPSFETTRVGWKYQDVVARLEERRKVKSAAYYERKKAARKQLSEAQKSAKIDEKTKTELAAFGY
ncbi:hypothetical protein DID88_009833 [Monilinia fructigena]|uniref:60S ribosomal protein L16 n=1 Tax=Monilinia fructigena TaxID=38457 RepID=A0A395IKB5_9HELO|nr:hypothetical protein DID88_009833 [Monilinia fructigena]